MYSNMYRCSCTEQRLENTGTASKPVITYASPTVAEGRTDPRPRRLEIVAGQTYVNNGFWDTYRTVWPAYSLFSRRPRRPGHGFVQQYKDGGWISAGRHRATRI